MIYGIVGCRASSSSRLSHFFFPVFSPFESFFFPSTFSTGRAEQEKEEEGLDGEYFKRFGGLQQGVTVPETAPAATQGSRAGRGARARPWAAPESRSVPTDAGSASLHSLVRKQGEGEAGTSCSRASSSRPAVVSAQPGGCTSGLRGGTQSTDRDPLGTAARRALSPQAPPHRELCGEPPPSP